MGIVIAILIFGFIIFIHEVGHFAAAKINKIKVHEFSLGLGPTLIGKTIKGTKFSLKLLPFGGACMMGEDDIDDSSEGSFNSKNVWQRISVIFGGPFMNLLTALILCMIMVGWNGFMPPVVGGVAEDMPAAQAGLEVGDRITRLDSTRVHMWDNISLFNMINTEGDPVQVTFIRDGETNQVTITPEFVEGNTFPMLGISSSERVFPGFFQTIEYGFYTLEFWISNTFQSLRMLITGRVGIESMSGPVGIVHVVDQTYQATVGYGVGTVVRSLMGIGILLSVSLGIFNLIPFPALDGGRLIFLFLEVIRRGKRVPPEKEGMVHLVGIVLLLTLMVVVLFNDIRGLFV